MAKSFKQPPKSLKTKIITKPSNANELDHDTLVKFSFKYLVRDNESYNIDDRSADYFLKTIERLVSVSSMTCASLKYPTLKPLRNHFINWGDTTQSSFGLPNEDQLVERPFQFGISANAHGRLIGFFIENCFYIVWFDPDHATYA